MTFVGDATAAHLAVNRNKNELMCRGLDDSDHRWLVNPMFIEPEEAPGRRRTRARPTGYTRPDGTLGPVHRADGSIVAATSRTASY